MQNQKVETMAKLIKLFTQEDCPKCPVAKETVDAAKKEGAKVKKYDIKGDPGAMAEAAFHEVMATPTIIIVDEKDDEIKSWRSKMPSKEDLLKAVDL